MTKVGNINGKLIIKVISFILFLSMVISYILPVYEEVNISLLSNKSKALATLEQETANNPILLPGMKAIYWENGTEKELKEPFNNKTVRLAISKAINRKDISNNIFNGFEVEAKNILSEKLEYIEEDLVNFIHTDKFNDDLTLLRIIRND